MKEFIYFWFPYILSFIQIVILVGVGSYLISQDSIRSLWGGLIFIAAGFHFLGFSASLLNRLLPFMENDLVGAILYAVLQMCYFVSFLIIACTLIGLARNIRDQQEN